MKRHKQDWIVIDQLADIIIAHPREFSYRLQPWEAQGCIVEIGAGKSTKVLAKHAQKWGVPHYTCDIKPVKTLHDTHIVFQGSSAEFMETFNDLPALVLLDGSHHCDDVRPEVEFFLSKLVRGGVIFIHDTYPPFEEWGIWGKHCGDIWKLRQELEQWPGVQIFTWPYTANCCGLTMIMNNMTYGLEVRQSG